MAKWIEGAAYILQKHDVPELREKIDGLIDLIEKNQLKDGYFNTHYITVDPQARFTDRSCHELYCAGHLMEAGVAYFEATGSDRLLKACEKYADLIKKVFIDEDSAAFSTPGHEEIELALVKLYRATGKKKYLEMSEYFVNMRGNNEKDAGTNGVFTAEYWQSHIPAREQKKAVGHSVRALYLYSAMADLAYELSDDELKDVCTVLFDDITSGKISITGGVGATTQNMRMLSKEPYITVCFRDCRLTAESFSMKIRLKLTLLTTKKSRKKFSGTAASIFPLPKGSRCFRAPAALRTSTEFFRNLRSIFMLRTAIHII